MLFCITCLLMMIFTIFSNIVSVECSVFESNDDSYMYSKLRDEILLCFAEQYIYCALYEASLQVLLILVCLKIDCHFLIAQCNTHFCSFPTLQLPFRQATKHQFFILL